MNNKDFVKAVAQATGISTIEVAELVAATAGRIVEEARSGNSVALPAFGSFEPKEKAERRIYNPTTKDFKTIPARRTLAFRPSNVLKEKIND